MPGLPGRELKIAVSDLWRQQTAYKMLSYSSRDRAWK